MFRKTKIQAFVMLLAVAAPLLFFAGFLVQQKVIQFDMEKKLSNNKLQAVTANITDIQWVRQDQEAIINGKLFDVSSYSITGNIISLKGLYDNDEDSLNVQLKDFVQPKNGAPLASNGNVMKYLFLPLFNNTVKLLCQNISRPSALNFFPSYQEKITAKHLSVVSPPPKFS